MRKGSVSPFLFLLISFFYTSITIQAQHFKDASEYLNFIGKQHRDIAKDIIIYSEKVLKGEARANEVLRKEILEKIKVATKRTQTLHPYKVDRSFQDSALKYYNLNYKVLDKEVKKIIAYEDSVEKDNKTLEPYLKLRQKMVEHLGKYEFHLNEYGKKFTSKYKLKQEYNDDDIYEKFIELSKLNNHYKTLSLAIQECILEHAKVVKYIESKDTTALKKGKAELNAVLKKSFYLVDTVMAIKGNKNLKDDARKVIQFYQTHEEFKIPTLIGYLKENATLPKESEVVKENTANYSSTLEEIKTGTDETVEHWKKSAKSFINYFLP